MFIGGSLTELFVNWVLELVEFGLYCSPETGLAIISETDFGPLSPGKIDHGGTKVYHPV